MWEIVNRIPDNDGDVGVFSKTALGLFADDWIQFKTYDFVFVPVIQPPVDDASFSTADIYQHVIFLKPPP